MKKETKELIEKMSDEELIEHYKNECHKGWVEALKSEIFKRLSKNNN